MLKGFKEFIMRGNVVDLAVAVVIGAAFGGVVTSFTDKILNPLLASLGDVKAPGLGFQLVEGNRATFVDIGAVISQVINFLMIAAAVYFFVVLPMNLLAARRKRGQEPEPEAPAEDVLLLQEIRDILAARGGETSRQI
ncbi:MAG TPA: large conductance mechanosensitive channel protein MscL [Nocardioidaceae bacterium]|nr:large conductance mechanosensitive channel protein MscL [Nocardioidaceae bacterium]